MVRPRWANMYTVKHGLPSVCQKQPFNHACYYLTVMENRLFLLFSATRPNFWSPNKKRQTFEVQRRLIAYLCKNILFSQPCKVALYRSKVTNWWLAFETLPKLAFWILSKRLYCFYPSSAFRLSGISSNLFCKVNHLNKYGFRPPCPPCHLFNRSTDWRADFVCTRSNRHTLDPPVRRGIMLERRPYYLLLHFLPFGERPLAIWRFVGELSRTFRPCVVRVWASLSV